MKGKIKKSKKLYGKFKTGSSTIYRLLYDLITVVKTKNSTAISLANKVRLVIVSGTELRENKNFDASKFKRIGNTYLRIFIS